MVNHMARLSPAMLNEKARQRGWKTKGTAREKHFELMALDKGRPLYKKTNNADAAISSGADILHSPPYNLDGSGLAVGVWDVEAVLGTHDELTGRVSVMDGAFPAHDHSTHVAGTIGASGVDPDAKGMAPGVYISKF